MEVVHWDEAVKNNLRNVGIPFQAGFVTGAFSSWEFSLARENNAVTVNLLLVEDRYNRRALFAGFTAYILNTEGNVYSQGFSSTLSSNACITFRIKQSLPNIYFCRSQRLTC